MKSLLHLAKWFCGPALRASVFEPLVADWERERRDAATGPAHARAWVAARWSLGFAVALIGCATRHAVSANGPMWRYGVVFVVAIAVSIAAETILMRLTAAPDYTWDLLLIGALRLASLATLAAAMLPAMFLLRRDPRATTRTAAGYIALGSVLMALTVVAQPSIENYRVTFSQSERMYQRARALDLADQYRYPATVEERRARYEHYLAMQQQAVALRPARSLWQPLQRSTAPLMVVIFGLIGWGVGGLVRPTFTRALIWWAIAWLTSLIAEGRVAHVLGLPSSRPAWWVFPAIASMAALSLLLAARHRRVSFRRV